MLYKAEEIFSELYDLDFVFISVPLTDETKQLINRKFLSAMKYKSILINISRGEYNK
jgi:lactate dehydrogenase-like 2-hydroxyacid dehydrogenase